MFKYPNQVENHLQQLDMLIVLTLVQFRQKEKEKKPFDCICM